MFCESAQCLIWPVFRCGFIDGGSFYKKMPKQHSTIYPWTLKVQAWIHDLEVELEGGIKWAGTLKNMHDSFTPMSSTTSLRCPYHRCCGRIDTMISKNPALQSLPRNFVGARERTVGTKGSTTKEYPSNDIRRDESAANKVRLYHALLRSLQATSTRPIVKRKEQMFYIFPVVPVLKCHNGSRDCVQASEISFRNLGWNILWRTVCLASPEKIDWRGVIRKPNRTDKWCKTLVDVRL